LGELEAFITNADRQHYTSTNQASVAATTVPIKLRLPRNAQRRRHRSLALGQLSRRKKVGIYKAYAPQGTANDVQNRIAKRNRLPKVGVPSF
jgi:hypothetical protein